MKFSNDAWIPVSKRMASDGNISTKSKAVYMAIKLHHPNPFPTYNLIMTYTGLSKRSVIRAVQELVDAQYLCVKKSHRKANQYSVVYFPGNKENVV